MSSTLSTRDVMIHWAPAWNSRCRPIPTQPSFKQLPPPLDPFRQARVPTNYYSGC